MMLIKKFSSITLILLVLINQLESLVEKRKKIIIDGDLMIGALLPVHEQPSYKTDSSIITKRKCGIIRDQYGIQRVEALLYMMDKINNHLKLLPGIKLGLEIRDECWETSVALEETIDFIKHTIASGDSDEDTFDNFPKLSNDKKVIEYTFNNSNDKLCQKILKDKNNQHKILAVVGPAGSTIAINVQNLLQLFDIPQVGYSATSTDLSDKKMFKTFLRVVPSDYLQVRAMADVVVKMNWTYVFAIYTDGSYGQGGMDAFRNKTTYLNICLAMYEKIREYASDEDYESLVKRMNATVSAKVIVCFCYGETIRGLLGAINRLNLKGRFIILGSDGWSDRIDVAKDFYEEAVGSLSLKAHSPVVTEFHDYFAALNPSNNLRNVWFNEYWEYRFNCYIDEDSKSKYSVPCKRRCPINFEQIGTKCYLFSSEKLNWPEARKMCKSKFHESDLLDLNHVDDLENLLNYLNKNDMKEHLARMHARVDLKSINNHDEYNLGDENIQFKICSSNTKRKKSDESFLNEPSDFESSISSEDVITYYNNKLYPNYQCISILTEKDNTNPKSNFSYCIELKNCPKKLPFVCKIEIEEQNENNSSIVPDYYPDSLRNYQQDPKMSYVINALLSIVHGLARVHQNVCGGVSGLCEHMKKLYGPELLTNIRESSFLGITGEKIYFDANGDPPGRYVVLNVQKEINPIDNTTRYVYKEVGNWNNDNKLTLDISKIKFPNEEENLVSVCSEECKFGHVKQIKQGGLKCCWNCKKCEDYSYILDEHTCQECDLGYWPNANLTGCDKLPLKYLKWSEPASIFAIFISILGIILNTFITNVFVRYSNTCIVKSTTKELSYIILFGVYLCYLMTIPLVLKPSLINCYLSRILPGLNLSIIYGALLTKTNRIARILSRSKKRILTTKPRFMSLTSQIVITIIIIAIECCLILAGLIFEPSVLYINYSRRNEARLQCSMERISIIGPLGYNMFLVAICTLYAIQTRNLPENFNEAKFIGFSMYTTCVIWIAFFPLFFGSDFKVITLCLSTSFSATVILAFLFIPKVYIILFEPEKNQRSAFTTSKNIRCHFGSNVQSSSGFENDVSSIHRKHSNGMFLLSAFKTPTHKNEKPKTSINYTRYAFRPKLSTVYNGFADIKSNDSFDNFTSMYQISDRSCQTSFELLPITKNSLKKRRVPSKDMSVSLEDVRKIEKNDDTANNLNALSTVGSILILPIIATASQDESRTSSDEIKNKINLKNKNILFMGSHKKNNSLNSILNEQKGNELNFDSNFDDTIDEENSEYLRLNLVDKSSFTEPTTDEYSIKMNHEEESLEELRRAMSKNPNLVLNWDYVQSSGYL